MIIHDNFPKIVLVWWRYLSSFWYLSLSYLFISFSPSRTFVYEIWNIHALILLTIIIIKSIIIIHDHIKNIIIWLYFTIYFYFITFSSISLTTLQDHYFLNFHFSILFQNITFHEIKKVYIFFSSFMHSLLKTGIKYKAYGMTAWVWYFSDTRRGSIFFYIKIFKWKRKRKREIWSLPMNNLSERKWCLQSWICSDPLIRQQIKNQF